MRNHAILTLGLAVLLGGRTSSAQEKSPPIDLQVVKYQGLKDAIFKNRGKVVLVDFWGEF